jgi:hypothetical protein
VVTDFYGGHSVSPLDYHAGKLVPQNQRCLGDKLSDLKVFIVVNVGPADTDAFDVDNDLIGQGRPKLP